MPEEKKRTTVYLDTELHRALQLKSVETSYSVSALINEAVRNQLSEDADDLASFKARESEATLSFEEFVRELKANGGL